MNPLVSVVITTYNRPEMVKQAIQSVLSQTYRPIEIIVVEDSSESDVEAWLKENKHTEIKYIRHDNNRGLAAARNTGLRCAAGKYISYLDDDDEWLPAKIEKQVSLLETQSKDTVVVHCGLFAVDMHGIRKDRPILMQGDIRSAIGQKGLDVIPDNSSLFLKEALQKIGGYDEDITSHAEYGIWMKMARAGYRTDFVNEHLVKTGEHQDYKITKDIALRTRATESFIEKWSPEWEQWFGTDVARTMCAQLCMKVFMKLAEIYISGLHFSAGMHCYGCVIQQIPWRIQTYIKIFTSFMGALISQTPLYAPIRKLWLKKVTSNEQ